MIERTSGNWGTLDFTATTYTTLQARSDATGFGFTANLSSPSSSVLNLRVFTSPSSANYFASQDGTLSAVLGARAGPAAGYIQIGLMR